jgi:DMSO/TMAO reductase YedYZ molybdopterin-dependent catalytic subunit
MYDRRRFIKTILGFLGGMGLSFGVFTAGIRAAFAKAKRIILAKGTRLSTLVGKDPAELDPRNLNLTPVEEFGTMGLDNYHVDLNKWRLEIGGHVQRPVNLKYAQLTEIPLVQRDVLLICPGFFAYYGRWKGVSVARLLDMAQAKSDVTHVSFSGPEGSYEKTEQFSIEEIRSGKVFLPYNVNGRALPTKHGFPLLVVAEDHYGGTWVKFVCKITANKA